MRDGCGRATDLSMTRTDRPVRLAIGGADFQMRLADMRRRWRFMPHPAAALYQSTFLIRRALFRKVAAAVRELRGDVLDFGCGSQPYRELFTKCNSYIGVDITRSGHDHGDSRVDVFYDGHRLPFDDSHFDAVVSFEVFEHVFNVDEVLKEIKRVLRPGGRLLLTTPFAWGEHESPYDFGRYTCFGIRSIVERNGLSVQTVEKTNGSIQAINQLWLTYIDVRLLAPLGVLGKVMRVPVSAAINLTAIALARILPDDDTFYSNLVVHAVRPIGESSEQI